MFARATTSLALLSAACDAWLVRTSRAVLSVRDGERGDYLRRVLAGASMTEMTEMTGAPPTVGAPGPAAPRIDHVALWVADLAASRDFYRHWFDGRPNGEYHNPRTGLRTCILRFGDLPRAGGGPRGARLELMTRPDVTTATAVELLGWAHLSFALPSRPRVDALVRHLAEAGVPVVDGPRVTGDGYYEAVLLDPDGNRVEVVAGDYPEEVALRGAAS